MRLFYQINIFLSSIIILITSNIVQEYDEEKLIACHDMNRKVINDKRQINSVGYGAKKYIGQENVLKKYIQI